MKVRAALAGLIVVMSTFALGAALLLNVGSGSRPLALQAPRSTVLYVEAPDLAGALERFRTSESHADFERSRSKEEIAKRIEELRALAKEGKGPLRHVHELGLELNEQTFMRVFGQGVALGLTAPKEGVPAGYFVTRMDVVGLAKDLATGGKWREVWTKLSAQLKGEDGKVEDYQGYQIVARPIEPGNPRHAFYSQVDDLLIAATSREPVANFIDVAVGKGESLSDHPGWGATSELEQKGLVGYAWADPGFWRDGERVRAAIVAAAKNDPDGQRGAEKLEETLTGKELARLATETQDLPGFAAGLHLGQAGTYEWTLSASHSADEVFKVPGEPLHGEAIAGPNPHFFASCKTPHVSLSSFLQSKGWQTLAATEAMQWLSKKLEKPNELGMDGMLPPDPAMQEALAKDPRFEIRTTLALLDLAAPELLGERWSLGMQMREGELKRGESPVEGAALITLRPALRALANVALGVCEAHSEKVEVTLFELEGTKGYGFKTPGGPEVCVALVGADLVASLSKERLAAALKAGRAGPGEGKLQRLMKEVPAEQDVAIYYDMGAMQEGMQRMAGPLPEGQDSEGKEAELTKQLQELQKSEALLTFDVADDWTSVSAHTVQGGMSDMIEAYMKGLYPEGAKLEDQTLALLPKETIMGGAFEADLQASVEGLRGAAGKQLNEMADEAKEFMLGEANLAAQDPEKHLLPHLGKTFGLGLVTQPKLVPKGAPKEQAAQMIAVPAALAFMTYESEELEPKLVSFVKFMIGRSVELEAMRASERVKDSLLTLHSAQDLFRSNDSDENGKQDYARSMMDMAQFDLLDWSVASGRLEGGYRLEMQRSEDEPTAKWMAIASPPNGVDVHYATTQAGQIVHSYEPIALNPKCELPAEAKPLEVELGEAPEGAPKASAPFSLVKAEIGGKPAYRLQLAPELERQRGPMGEGISPCFSFADGVFRVASSEHALSLAMKGESKLTESPRFQRLRKHLQSSGSALAYFHWGGLIDQILANGELLATQAAPTPPELKAPPRPRFPNVEQEEGEDPEAAMKRQQAAMDAYRKESEAYQEKAMAARQKQKEWREQNAKQNEAKLAELLGSLRVLGGMVSNGERKGDLLKGASVMALDPEAAPAKK